MKKKQSLIVGLLLFVSVLFAGCFGGDNAETAVLPDGTYIAEFNTDSSMFAVNEAHEGKGTLTVENGIMTIHISLASKNILNLYQGLAENAKKEDAVLLEPTIDVVTYSDGWISEVYGFDILVPMLDEEFDVALIGKKEKWYDHKVSVSNPVPFKEEIALSVEKRETITALVDGIYSVDVTLGGGSGKSTVLSPTILTIADGSMVAKIEWSSPNYDYMLVNGEKYLPVNTEGNSVFEIPIAALDTEFDVIGDTVAMSSPREIEYTLTFHSATMKVVE